MDKRFLKQASIDVPIKTGALAFYFSDLFLNGLPLVHLPGILFHVLLCIFELSLQFGQTNCRSGESTDSPSMFLTLSRSPADRIVAQYSSRRHGLFQPMPSFGHGSTTEGFGQKIPLYCQLADFCVQIFQLRLVY